MSENPNNPQPQFNQAPQFSQQAPQYGQQAPQYGQQAPYGQPVPTPEQQAQAKKAKTLSIVSLVSGIVGLFIFGYILGVVAIVTGRLAMNNPELKNRGMAIAGTILGVVGILLMLVLKIFVKY
ncbi:DUF4190 domain-containing protein [uncultured Rothia sp.]|uniref:DUF4190 domain-containing protein n=1 Tax=uncultured Rothia sp. TaxID=316088 RepID=UPI0025E78B33|nr:DUF4190 domain-containing protein [uncultured Rothia sp.]